MLDLVSKVVIKTPPPKRHETQKKTPTLMLAILIRTSKQTPRKLTNQQPITATRISNQSREQIQMTTSLTKKSIVRQTLLRTLAA